MCVRSFRRGKSFQTFSLILSSFKLLVTRKQRWKLQNKGTPWTNEATVTAIVNQSHHKNILSKFSIFLLISSQYLLLTIPLSTPDAISPGWSGVLGETAEEDCSSMSRDLRSTDYKLEPTQLKLAQNVLYKRFPFPSCILPPIWNDYICKNKIEILSLWNDWGWSKVRRLRNKF